LEPVRNSLGGEGGIGHSSIYAGSKAFPKKIPTKVPTKKTMPTA
jgi:hypothetical protein